MTMAVAKDGTPFAYKDPNAVLDYRVDWTDWLGADTIVTATAVVPAGLVKGVETNTTTAHTIWLSGGVAGQSYLVTSRITTAGGRTEDRSFRLICKER